MAVPIPAKPKRRLGQNFLRDENIIQKIINYFRPSSTDWILEIGAGTGALTASVAPLVERFIAVEFDEELIPILQNIPQIEVISADIRTLDLHSIADKKKLRVIGNLPYYISTPILTYLVEQRASIIDMVLMFQQEVAERILAEPSFSEYSLISVLCQYYCEVEKGFRVSRNCFVPRPEVESRVLKFHFRTVWQLDYAKYFLFLTKAFSQRRKKLRNNLLRTLDISPDQLDAIFSSMQIPENARAENLSPSQFERLILETNSMIHRRDR